MLFIEEKTEEALSFFLEEDNICVKLPEEGGKEAEVSLPDIEELEESIPQPAELEKVGLIPGDYIDAEGESIAVEEVSQAIVEQVVALGEFLLPSEEIKEELEEIPVTARGKLLAPGWLERWKKAQESQPGCSVNWVREDVNHLGLSFDLAGGGVTGSYTRGGSMNYTDPGGNSRTITCCDTVNLTGSYSGGETGNFEGVGSAYDPILGFYDFTWSAEMTSGGQISGGFHYTVRHTDPSVEDYSDWLDFTASLVD